MLAVAAGARRGKSVVVSGSSDQTLRVWIGQAEAEAEAEAGGGTWLVSPRPQGRAAAGVLEGHTGGVTCVALYAVGDDACVVVSGYADLRLDRQTSSDDKPLCLASLPSTGCNEYSA